MILTCQVEGGGTPTYLWTSTCTGSSCFIYRDGASRTTQVVGRTVLKSVDSGTHICMATRGGQTGSATIEMNVVGE